MENTPANSSQDHQKQKHNFFQSKTFKWAVFILAELILLIGVFDLGMKVAFHKARFTESWTRNYPKNFGRPMMKPDSHFFNAHGLEGKILSIEKNSLTIKDQDNNEKTVLLLPTTTIRKNNSDIKPADLKVNDEIVVIGAPNDQGQVEARLIRVLNQ